MQCRKCNSSMPDDAKFCGNCGAAMDTGTDDSSPSAGLRDRMTAFNKVVALVPEFPRNNPKTSCLALIIVLLCLMAWHWWGLVAVVAAVVALYVATAMSDGQRTSVEDTLNQAWRSIADSNKDHMQNAVTDSGSSGVATGASQPATLEQRPTQPNAQLGQNGQTVIVNTVVEKKGNGCGVAGFVLALLSFVLSWTGPVGWVVWFIGALCSFIGLFRKPRVFAIIGFVISFIDLFVLIAVVGALTAIF